LRYVKAIAKVSRLLGKLAWILPDRAAKAHGMDQFRTAEAGKHIMLVVDDDAAVRSSLKFILEVEGFRVRVYASAEELLNEESLPNPGCLVVDYHMPGMNGLELVARLRDRQVLIPAILITPAPSQNLCNRAAAAGISIVEKPLLGSRLLDSIREAFDGHIKSAS
jgi:two-component system response regulator FixJ